MIVVVMVFSSCLIMAQGREGAGAHREIKDCIDKEMSKRDAGERSIGGFYEARAQRDCTLESVNGNRSTGGREGGSNTGGREAQPSPAPRERTSEGAGANRN